MLALVGVFLAVICYVAVITFWMAFVDAVKLQLKYRVTEDLELNEKNQITKGIVDPRYRSITGRVRPQPTWMN